MDQPGYAHLVNGNGRCLASMFNSPNRGNNLISWDFLPDERGQQWQQRSNGHICTFHGQCIASNEEHRGGVAHLINLMSPEPTPFRRIPKIRTKNQHWGSVAQPARASVCCGKSEHRGSGSTPTVKSSINR